MKKTVLMMTVILTVGASGAARAESQIYNPYSNNPAEYGYNNAASRSMAGQGRFHQQPNGYMVYPGRESYGQNFGPIPRHPGDYRDAIDRGSWSGGGGGIGGAGNRSFDIR